MIPLTPIYVFYAHERIQCDLICMSQYANENDDYKYIFNLIDCFSKFVFSFKIRDRSGNTIAKIVKNLFMQEGPWKEFHTDNGTEFRNNNVDNVLQQFNIERVLGALRSPTT